MATFVLTTLTQNPDAAQYETWALGASGQAPLTDNDIGKVLKLGTAQNMLLCATTNEIDGVLTAIEAGITYNSGYALGTVQRRGRFEALVGANQGQTAMAVGDLVVADTQAAVNTTGGAKVITGTPSLNKWRCIRIISGTGVAGDSVLVERI